MGFLEESARLRSIDGPQRGFRPRKWGKRMANPLPPCLRPPLRSAIVVLVTGVPILSCGPFYHMIGELPNLAHVLESPGKEPMVACNEMKGKMERPTQFQFCSRLPAMEDAVCCGAFLFCMQL